MRTIFAGLFVFTSMLVVVGLISKNYPDDHWPWWATIAPILTLFVSLFLSMFIFNRRGLRPNFSGKSLQEQIADLDRDGLLLKDSFRAVRAFAVEEFEDEGPHYYIELEDGRVLYLNGQYLYDFEPISDDPDMNQPRKFPCTEFRILRHKQEGFVIDIECQGEVIEPELTAPHYTKEDWKRGVPSDGDIISDRSYEEIKTTRQGLTLHSSGTALKRVASYFHFRQRQMRTYESNQQFYDHIDEVVVSLRSAGQVDIADQIDYLLHKVAWTTSSELFGELRDRFEQALKSPTPLPPEIEVELKSFIATIKQAWGRANGAV